MRTARDNADREVLRLRTISRQLAPGIISNLLDKMLLSRISKSVV
jgi:hypothetical protein